MRETNNFYNKIFILILLIKASSDIKINPIMKVIKSLKQCIAYIDFYETNLQMTERKNFISAQNKDFFLATYKDLISIVFKLIHVNIQVGLYRRIMFWVSYLWRIGNKYCLGYNGVFSFYEIIFKFALEKETDKDRKKSIFQF